MLSKDDVDKMVREAEAHADDDKKRRAEVELRNQAEQLTYQAERTLKDLGDKVPSEDRASVDSQVAAIREQLKGDDASGLESAMTTLVETLSKISTAAYQAAGPAGDGSSEPGSGDGSGGPGSDGAPGATPEGDETVEGEFKEV